MAHHSCRWRFATPALSHHVLPFRPVGSIHTTQSMLFTTTPSLNSSRDGKKKNPNLKAPRRGERRAFQNKKKRGNTPTRSGPAPGERRAYKKRIILSNVNALDVRGLAPLDTTRLDPNMQGKVMTLPGPLVDRLRALGSFRATQNWGLFKHPSTLIRPETVTLESLMNGKDGAIGTQRVILAGLRASGKSVVLLQAQALAFLKDWVVITVPEAMDVVGARTDYRPIPDSDPVQYYQKTYMADLLSRTHQANPILAQLHIETAQTRALPHSESLKTLADLCKNAASDIEQSWPTFLALWHELQQPGRPPVLMSLDGLPHVMRNSLYRNASYQPIHAHELALVNWFMERLSGAQPLANGGLVLAAMSSTSPDMYNRTLEERLGQIETEQSLARGERVAPSGDERILPFLEATGQQPSPIPSMDPLVPHDQRVFDVLGRGRGILVGQQPGVAVSDAEGTMPAKKRSPGRKKKTDEEAAAESSAAPATAPSPSTASEATTALQPARSPPHIMRVAPLDRAAARSLMEYWARSGMLRAPVTPALVDREWTLSGGGVLGELERSMVKHGALNG